MQLIHPSQFPDVPAGMYPEFVFYWRYHIGLIILSEEILDKWRKDAVVLMKKERRNYYEYFIQRTGRGF